MLAGPIAVVVGSWLESAGYNEIAGLLIMAGLIVGSFLFYIGYQMIRGRITIDLEGFPGPWREWVFGLLYIAWLLAGAGLALWLIYTGTYGYALILLVGGLLVWLVMTGRLGRVYLLYLLGFVLVVVLLIATNTVQFGIIAAVVALILYGGVIQFRQEWPSILQVLRDAISPRH